MLFRSDLVRGPQAKTPGRAATVAQAVRLAQQTSLKASVNVTLHAARARAASAGPATPIATGTSETETGGVTGMVTETGGAATRTGTVNGIATGTATESVSATGIGTVTVAMRRTATALQPTIAGYPAGRRQGGIAGVNTMIPLGSGAEVLTTRSVGSRDTSPHIAERLIG